MATALYHTMQFILPMLSNYGRFVTLICHNINNMSKMVSGSIIPIIYYYSFFPFLQYTQYLQDS